MYDRSSASWISGSSDWKRLCIEGGSPKTSVGIDELPKKLAMSDEWISMVTIVLPII